MSDLRERKLSFIKKSIDIHNNFYSYDNVDYINAKVKVKINCPIHGIFKQRPNDHLMGHGCFDCGSDKTKEKQRSKFELLITQYNKIHKGKFDYSKSEYINNRSPILIICKEHGIEFNQTPYGHSKGHVGCKLCKFKSKGEEKVKEFLDRNNIDYIREYRFDDCCNKYKLPFDFYCPDINICIEYDGRQHYDKTSLFYSEDLINNDKIKNEYCKFNKINLIRIKKSNIKEKLNHISNSLKQSSSDQVPMKYRRSTAEAP